MIWICLGDSSTCNMREKTSRPSEVSSKFDYAFHTFRAGKANYCKLQSYHIVVASVTLPKLARLINGLQIPKKRKYIIKKYDINCEYSHYS